MRSVLLVLIAMAALGSGGGWKSEWRDLTVTAYCPCTVCTKGSGKTATGRDARKDGVAVDKSVIPWGSRLDIPGATTGANGNGSWLLADDSGSAITGNIVDLRLQSHKQAKEWGRKQLRVRIWTRRK